MNKLKIAHRLQVIGAGSLSAAGFVAHTVAGFVVAGVLAIVFGVALEREAAATIVPVVAVEGDA